MKLNPLYMTKLKSLSFLLNAILIFSVLVDPTNELLHLKNISFVLFVLVSLPFANFRDLKIILVFLCVYFISFLLGLMFDENLDYQRTNGILKSFLFLTYIFWCSNHYLKSIKIFYYVMLFVAIVNIAIYLLMTSSPDIESIFYSFFSTHNNVVMVNMNRTFLGLHFASVYIRTSSVFTICLAFVCYYYFTTKKNSYLIQMLIFMGALFCSGTRANMLSGIMIVLFAYSFYTFYIKKKTLKFILIFILFAISALLVIMKLLNDNDVSSLGVKKNHIISYRNLFEQNPLQFVFCGKGPGTIFYSKGFNRFCSYTELSYYDLIKDFGLIQTIILCLLLLSPVFFIFKNTVFDRFFKITISIGYLAYLFISGTNPLLISSTGFIVFAIIGTLGTCENFSLDIVYKSKSKKLFLLKHIFKYKN